MFIVLQPDNDIMGVFDTLEKAITCAKSESGFWGWIEEWEMNSNLEKCHRIDYDDFPVT